MEMGKKLHGAEHPDTLFSMEKLAFTYGKLGRWNEAEQLAVQVMKITKKLLNVEHQVTLTSLAKLAITYCDQGRWN